jgi:hypothetical protein
MEGAILLCFRVVFVVARLIVKIQELSSKQKHSSLAHHINTSISLTFKFEKMVDEV